ncbi:hypothetical protein HAP54_000049405 [Bradyrhizobium sp. 2S1]|nr:hypothetical protein [Bradyrhizobium sp. 2S1]MCK7667830.1 GNAT family N-acetyltransferase [Bradyrhizobium sp. 2S1]
MSGVRSLTGSDIDQVAELQNRVFFPSRPMTPQLRQRYRQLETVFLNNQDRVTIHWYTSTKEVSSASSALRDVDLRFSGKPTPERCIPTSSFIPRTAGAEWAAHCFGLIWSCRGTSRSWTKSASATGRCMNAWG